MTSIDNNPIPEFNVHGRGATRASKGNNVIAVSSGKGGVGKTWFSITLSHALANARGNVLLFDGDLGLANVDVQLGLMPKFDLSSVLSRRRSLKAAITRFQEGGFDIIAGQSGAGSLASVTRNRLAELREDVFALGRGYDHTVMDIGAGIDHTVQTLLLGAGTNLVITTGEPTSLTDAYALIKIMTRNDAGEGNRIQVVVNMATDERQGNHTYQTLLRACEGFLKVSPPLAGIIRRDGHVADSIRHQCSLFVRHPNCDAAEDITAIVEKIRSKL